MVLRVGCCARGLRNLLQERRDFARAECLVETAWMLKPFLVAHHGDGMGIPRISLGRIGDPFHAVAGSEPRLHPGAQSMRGMGLRLFIAKKQLLEAFQAQS